MQQLSQIIDLDSIQNQKGSRDALDKALRFINSKNKDKIDKDIAKRKTHQFMTLIFDYLKSQKSPPKSKFYTLYILKLITQKDERTILSVLTSHSLLKHLTFIAKTIDPYSSIEQKGRNLWPDKNLGNDYVRLILESLKVWGIKFSNNKNNQKSHFKKAYDELVQRKIVMPQQLKFYDSKIYESVGVNNQTFGHSVKQAIPLQKAAQTRISQSVYKQRQSQPLSQNMKLMQYDIDKINQFSRRLEGKDLQQQAHSHHKLFAQQKQKYESIINNLVTSNNQKELQIALAINQFYIQQQKAYKQFLNNKRPPDFYSYVNLINMKVDQLNSTTQTKQQPKQLVKKEVVKKEVTKQITIKKNNPTQHQDGQNKQIVSKLMHKLRDDKAHYQGNSFRNIKQSLSKDKSIGRNKRSTSGLKKSSISRFGKSASKSKIAQIFYNPPNPYPQQKRYSGQLIQNNKQLSYVIKSISKNQGHRRFITSNFKAKNPLFQNNHIQIGFKSQAIYDQVNEFRVILSIELFLGNKTDNQILNLSIDYKGNTDLLLYANPRKVQSHLAPGYQIKHQLLIVPLNNKPSFIKLYLQYQIKGQIIQQKITLPNSLIKLAQYAKLNKKEFVQNWNASKIIKTNQFKLTNYISPDTFTKYIAQLSQLSPYDQFLRLNSQTDYQIGCSVIIKRKYQGVLRISIRPNLHAVLQIGITDSNQQAYQAFTYYLQNFQMLLSQFDHSY